MKHTIEIIILALLAANIAHAKHQVPAHMDETISLKIAENTYNRLFIKGERIQVVRGLENDYDLEKDEVNGEIYIRIKKVNEGEPVSLFLTTEQAQNYHVLLTPDSFAEPVIELVPEMFSEKQTEILEKNIQEDPVQRLINFVLMGLHKNTQEKLHIESINNSTEQYLYDSFVLRQQALVSDEHYKGMIYEVFNRSDEVHPLRGDYFYTDNAIAVGLQEIMLEPKTSTRVFVVSHKLQDSNTSKGKSS